MVESNYIDELNILYLLFLNAKIASHKVVAYTEVPMSQSTVGNVVFRV